MHKDDCHKRIERYPSDMKAVLICAAVLSCVAGVDIAYGAPAPDLATNVVTDLSTVHSIPADGVRPEDIMIDDDAIGDVWDTVSPADAIGIASEDTDVLPAVTAKISSAELLHEKELLKPPRAEPEGPQRFHTRRWRPQIPIQTIFYLALAVVVVGVLLLKARG